MTRFRLPLDADRPTAAQLGYATWRSFYPDMKFPDPGLTTAAVESHAEISAYAREGGSGVDDEIAVYLAESIFGYPRNAATYATCVATWTMVDTVGYRIAQEETVITLRTPDGGRWPFQATDDIVIAPGSASQTGVQMVAIEPGIDGTGLSQDPQLENARREVATVEITTPSQGGRDAESVDDYLTRLRTLTRLFSPMPILNTDFEARPRALFGVRALAIDNYIPAGPGGSPAAQTGVEGAITVALADPATGLALPDAIKDQIQADFQSVVGTGDTVYLIDPTYTAVSFSYTATSYPPYDPAEVHARADAALIEFLSPARWGNPPYGDEPLWLDTPIVRATDLIGVLEAVDGLDQITAYTLGGGGATLALVGPAGLPAPNPTITGTVT